jgi:glutamate carboxypeptidase
MADVCGRCLRSTILSLLLALAPVGVAAQPNETVRALAQRETQPLLDTLKALVEIESGTADVEGVTRIGALIADRLRGLGGSVELVPAAADRRRVTSLPQQFADTVVARFRGRGAARILLLAHMDTVYERGMLAQQPFRIDGDRAYGLGIADAKHGIAVILHALTMLKALSVDGYGVITVLVSPDEEVGSLAERDLITKLGAEHDVVLSFEGPTQTESIRLATSGIQLAVLTVTGRASHAGNAPEQGRNALYELSHQLLQLRDLSEPARAVKLNWTLATAGTVYNTIPAAATAVGDMRADDPNDFQGGGSHDPRAHSKPPDPRHQGRCALRNRLFANAVLTGVAAARRARAAPLRGSRRHGEDQPCVDRGRYRRRVRRAEDEGASH